MPSPNLNIHIPDGLPELLQQLTVSILRNQPSDILDFATEYFIRLRNERGEGRDHGVAFIGSFEDSEEMPDEMRGATAGGKSPPKDYGRRKSVTAERYDPAKEDDLEIDSLLSSRETITQDTEKMLDKAMDDVFLFQGLSKKQRKQVIFALKAREVRQGEYIIRQGEPGDNFYIIERGSFAIYIRSNDDDEEDGERKETLDGKGGFGELALMYDQPRAATIKAVTDGVIWALDRMTFRRIVLHSEYQRRKLFDGTLANIPMLKVKRRIN
jgi:cAMP-dependent protein kinase regulator